MRLAINFPSFVGCTTLLFIVACSNGSTTFAPSSVGPRAVFTSQKPSKQTLFVADDFPDQVLLYDPTIPNPTPKGTITDGIYSPCGLAVDNGGNLYVVNGNSTITVYPRGKTKPSFTIDRGLGDAPYAIAVDSTGIVYVSEISTNAIIAYLPGHKTPFETIKITTGQQPGSLAVDSADNLYIANGASVLELQHGSKKPMNLDLSDVNGAGGLSFRSDGALYVSNGGSNSVTVYKKGTKKPSLILDLGMDAPTFSTFVPDDRFFQMNQNNYTIEGFLREHRRPFSKITGLTHAFGIASSPRQQT